ncbi:MAG TPA: hypothetical protein VH683_07125 [Thermoleophilaceae bacterium]
MASNKRVETAADELYGLPPGEFTSARDERVKQLRKDDREAADAVKALKKPTVAAWALNQLARERGKDVDALLKAGEKLQSAQEDLLAGGDRAAFQRAAATERELVAELAAEAVSLTRESRERPGAGLEEKIAATLHAAALDEETADRLRAGRLTKEQEAIGGFGSFGADDTADTPTTRAGSAPKRGAAAKPVRADKEARRSPEEAGKDSKKAGKAESKRAAANDSAEQRVAEAAARERLAGARTDERHARRELDAATKAVEHAKERADAAAAHAAEAKDRAKKTANRLGEAKQAETAAKKAHTKAARALKSAEAATSSDG